VSSQWCGCACLYKEKQEMSTELIAQVANLILVLQANIVGGGMLIVILLVLALIAYLRKK
jgi:hypothetical protein